MPVLHMSCRIEFKAGVIRPARHLAERSLGLWTETKPEDDGITACWLQRKEDPISVFMGVPTMYYYLLNAYDKMDAAEQGRAREAAQRLRLTVCGSSACPLHIMERWRHLSGDDRPCLC